MTTVPFLELVVIAFVAQLLVLPGEKGQLIVAGLATRYNPLLVVAAAGSAFAGWTVVEIYVGSVIQDVLPGFWLSVFTGTLFLAFAYLLWTSAPRKAPAQPRTDGGDPTGTQPGSRTAESDGGILQDERVEDVTILGREIPDSVGAFASIFTLMAAGEFGDKTQLVTIGLAAEYGARAGILVGEMLAIVPVSLANAYLFHTFSHRFDLRKAHLAGAVVFAFFAVDTALSLTIDVSVWELLVETLADAVEGIVLGG